MGRTSGSWNEFASIVARPATDSATSGTSLPRDVLGLRSAEDARIGKRSINTGTADAVLSGRDKVGRAFQPLQAVPAVKASRVDLYQATMIRLSSPQKNSSCLNVDQSGRNKDFNKVWAFDMGDVFMVGDYHPMFPMPPGNAGMAAFSGTGKIMEEGDHGSADDRGRKTS